MNFAIWLKSFEMIMEKQMIEEEKEEPAEELSDEEYDAMWASILSIYFWNKMIRAKNLRIPVTAVSHFIPQ